MTLMTAVLKNPGGHVVIQLKTTSDGCWCVITKHPAGSDNAGNEYHVKDEEKANARFRKELQYWTDIML